MDINDIMQADYVQSSNGPVYMSGVNAPDVFKNINKELINKNIMSCSIVTYQNDKFYVISDRRIEVNGQLFDNYQKSILIPNTKIVITSNGEHPYGSLTIKNIIETLNSDNLNDIIDELDLKMQKLDFLYGSETYFEICGFNSFDLRPFATRLTVKKGYTHQVIQADIHKNNGLLFSGSNLAHSIIPYIQNDVSYRLFNDTKSFMIDLMENIENISINLTNSKNIGGGFDLFILSRNKIEHIQKKSI